MDGYIFWINAVRLKVQKEIVHECVLMPGSTISQKGRLRRNYNTY